MGVLPQILSATSIETDSHGKCASIESQNLSTELVHRHSNLEMHEVRVSLTLLWSFQIYLFKVSSFYIVQLEVSQIDCKLNFPQASSNQVMYPVMMPQQSFPSAWTHGQSWQHQHSFPQWGAASHSLQVRTVK